MSEIFSSTPFILLLVLGSYLAGCKLYRKKHIALFHPLLVAMVLIIALLSLLGIDYDTFCAGSSFISFLLGPSVVALGYALYTPIGIGKLFSRLQIVPKKTHSSVSPSSSRYGAYHSSPFITGHRL